MAGNSKDQQTQLDINSQINKVLSDRTAILSAQEKALSSQVQLAVDLCKALKCEQLDEIEARLKTARDEMQRAADAAKNYGGALSSAADSATDANEKTISSVRDLWGAFKELNPVVAGAATGLGVGFVRGLGSAFQTAKNLVMGIGGIISTLGKLAFTIIGLPFRLLEGLFDLAQSGGGGPSPLLVELENIRKQFGSLKTNEGAAAAGALREFRKDYSNLAGTGLSIRRVFGQGLEGLAKALAENAEVAKELGTAFHNSMDIIRKFGPELAVYRKGMGFTAAQQAMLIKTTKAMGGDSMDRMRKIGSMAIRMGNQFGINSKVITQSVGEMISDFPRFGTIGEKAMTQIAVYAHKVGIEVKELAGIVDAFDDFEDAATRTAKAAQTFGMQLDTIGLVDEQDAAARLSMVQKSFRESGKVFEQLNRAERKQLGLIAGLTDATAVAAAFGKTGLAQSYGDIQKAGAKAEKQQMSQTEVLKKLADSIERVFGSGGGTKFKGFFDAFTKGFMSGIHMSRTFRRAMRAIRRSLMVVYRAGRQVGRMFVEMFPGIKKMLVGIRELFSPRRFYNFMQDVKKAFAKLFIDLRTDPKAGIERFLKTFKERLASFFKSSGPAAKGFLAGGKEFLKTVWSIFKVVFAMVVDGLASAARAITEFLKNPPDIQSPIVKAFQSLKEALMPLFSIIAEKLWPALAEMFTVMWEKAKPTVMQWGKYILYASLLKIFVQAIYGAVVGAIGGAIGKVIASGALKLFTKLFKIATPPVPKPESAPANPSAGGFVRFLGYLAAILGAAVILMLVYDQLNMEPEDAVAIGLLLVGIVGAAIAISLALKAMPGGLEKEAGKLLLLVGFVAAISFVAVKVLESLSEIKDTSNLLETVPAFLGVMLGLVMASIPLILGAAVVGAMEAAAAEAAIGMVVIGVTMGALGALAAALTLLLSLFDKDRLKSTGIILLAITAMMLAIVPVIPVAAALGVLASETFGIGALVILAGFEIIGYLIDALVLTLLPAIYKLSEITIPNPESFTAVVGALVSIVDAVSSFVKFSALLAFALQPASDANPAQFESNMNSFKGITESIIKSGFGEIINNLIEFSKTANVKSGTGEIISAISSVLTAAASLMQAFTPSETIGKTVAFLAAISAHPLAHYFAQSASDKLIKYTNDSLEGAKKMMLEIFPVLKLFLSDIGPMIQSIPPGADKIAPLIGAIGPILTGVAAVLKALDPSDAAWSTLTDFGGWFPGGLSSGPTRVHRRFDEQQKWKQESFVGIITHLRDMVVMIVTGIKQPISDIIASASGLSEASAKAVIPLVTSVISFATDLISNVGPIISAAADASKDAPEGQRADAFSKTMTSITEMMKQIGPVFGTLAEPLKLMINGVLDIAKGISGKDLRGLKSKIDVVTAAIQAVGAMSSIFKSGGDLTISGGEGGRIDESLIKNIGLSMKSVKTYLLQPGGPLEKLAEAMEKIKLGDTRKIKNNSASVKTVADAAAALGASFSADSGLAIFGSQGFYSNASNMVSGINSVASLFTGRAAGNGIFMKMNDVITQIPQGVANRSSEIEGMFETFKSISTALRDASFAPGELATLVELNNALTGDGKLKIDHGNLEIKIDVHVEMSAEQVAKGIIRWNETSGRDVRGTRRFMTEAV